MRTVLLMSRMFCLSLAGGQNYQNENGPDLSGRWPTTGTLAVLKDAGLVDTGQIASTYTTRLASEKENKYLWHQLYYVEFKLRTGATVQAIAAVDESPIADMRSGPAVYVVSKILQPEGKPTPEIPKPKSPASDHETNRARPIDVRRAICTEGCGIHTKSTGAIY